MSIQTHLVKKTAKDQQVCTNCNSIIPAGNIYHLEEGIDQHLHSLIARRFCSECYAKYGEKKLLTGNK